MLAGAVGLVVDGRVTRLSAHGSITPGRQATDTKTLFGIGSITKFLLALAVSRVGSQRVPLDSPVSALLPNLTFDDNESFGDVTVTHLLSHTSGLPAAGRDWGPTGADALSRFASEDLAHHLFQSVPGEVATYSSTATSLIGLVLEEVGSKSFPQVLRDEALQPAGMGGATFPTELADSVVAWPHRRSLGDYQRMERLADNPAGYPSGFLLASAEDLSSLALALLDGTLLRAKDVERMAMQQASRHIDHVPYPLALISSGYGLGCFTGEWNGQPVFRHGGIQQSFTSSFDVFPDSGSAVVLLTNAAEESAFSEILALCYEAVAGPATAGDEPNLTEVGSADRQRWLGNFIDPDGGRLLDVVDVDGDLVYRSEDLEAPIYYVGDGRALVPASYGSAPLWFPPADGPVPYVMVWGQPFFRTSIEPWAPEDPMMFEGPFRDSFWPDPSTDIDVRFGESGWRVAGNSGASKATPIGERRVATDQGLVEFSRDGSSLRLGNATIYERS